MKELLIAKKCLEKTIKMQKKDKDTSSLMYQFCLQMRNFCIKIADKEITIQKKEKLLGEAKEFNVLAKIYRKVKKAKLQEAKR